jgi:hypothetical protein
MPGNEIEVIKYLVRNNGKIELPHLGLIESIGAPRSNLSAFTLIKSEKDLALVSSENSSKKADIYLNGRGVSIKQSGGSFAFNRIQRANIQDLFNKLGFRDVKAKLARIDTEVQEFHEGKIPTRNRPWESFFEQQDFEKMLEFLMMKGSPNLGLSKHPAEYILQAENYLNCWHIDVFTFNEYFRKYKDFFRIAIRRQWIGQDSKSEHTRALSLAKKNGNMQWIYDNVVGVPSSGWMLNFPIVRRKTVYFLMVEKLA